MLEVYNTFYSIILITNTSSLLGASWVVNQIKKIIYEKGSVSELLWIKRYWNMEQLLQENITWTLTLGIKRKKLSTKNNIITFPIH